MHSRIVCKRPGELGHIAEFNTEIQFTQQTATELRYRRGWLVSGKFLAVVLRPTG
jgi:hypothetical protein